MKRLLAMIAMACMGGGVAAQDWPRNPVQLVVPFAPGGNVDIIARLIGEKLQKVLGQPVVVSNKPGAGGAIAADQVSRAAPDGYTFFVGSNGPLLFAPVIAGKKDFEWKRDFAVAGPVAFTPIVVVANPALPARGMDELLKLAKERKLFMASAGTGSTNDLLSQLIQERTGVAWTSVPYKGNAQTVVSVSSGEVDFSIEQISAALPFIKDRRIRAIAVSSRERSPLLPDTPTLAEAGLQGMEAVTWTGLFAPAATPVSILERMNDALRAISKDPDLLRGYQPQGLQPFVLPRAEFAAYVDGENDKWLPFVKRAFLKNP
ncbi:tripartite tricarboxylate transporter substrate binding protein [Pigmentiphaga soli]|uniref:Tripartite tricarboxylate transporter substrate binding protein n=1 Tax=Pigmentiphaga soli TaxID=1007095 RepID=A0ABP8H7V4_9BURK